MKKRKPSKSLEEQFKDDFKIEYEHTVKSFKSINRNDLPLYKKKYDGDWLYRLRVDEGRLKVDRIVLSPYYEITESTISAVLSLESIDSNQDEWRLGLNNVMKYYQENE
tara:strand:- start:1536 stop:1862 length:327 start_codon:yes stop_codon:yes gene_type:complete